MKQNKFEKAAHHIQRKNVHPHTADTYARNEEKLTMIQHIIVWLITFALVGLVIVFIFGIMLIV